MHAEKDLFNEKNSPLEPAKWVIITHCVADYFQGQEFTDGLLPVSSRDNVE
jgi:hypothetical protein